MRPKVKVKRPERAYARIDFAYIRRMFVEDEPE